MLTAVTPWLDPGQWSDHDLGVLTALGTVGAVVVAVGAGALRSAVAARRQPSLSLSFEQRADTAIEDMALTFPDGTTKQDRAAFIRLAVTNHRRRHAAEDVEVLIVGLHQLDALRETYGESAVMAWADGSTRLNFAPLGWTHLEPTSVTVGPGVTRTVDFGWQYEYQSLSFYLGVKPPPLSGLHVLSPGTWKVTFAVSARNADAAHHEMTFQLEGTWGSGQDDVWNHLRVTEPPKRVKAPVTGTRRRALPRGSARTT
jgi:hypothetical protein